MVLLSIIPSVSPSNAADDLNQSQRVTGSSSLANMPPAFTQNIGQWPDSILFRTSAGGTIMWFTKDGIYYQLLCRKEQSGSPPDRSHHRHSAASARKVGQFSDTVVSVMIKAEFAGASRSVQVTGLEQTDYRCNYFLGDDPARWRSNVPNYRAVIFKGIYEGVDLIYRADGATLTLEASGPSGHNVDNLPIVYRSAAGLTDPEGAPVTIQTALGEKRFANGLPVVDPPLRRAPASRSAASANVTLVYSTFLGGASTDISSGIMVEASGQAYITGYTLSADFPTQNGFDGSYNGGTIFGDAFVTKLSESGAGLVYSTYLGGSGDEISYGIAVDASGQAYVTGQTMSTNYPTLNAIDASSNGHFDAFVTKLTASGAGLAFSTYLGGNNWDYGEAIAVNGTGQVFVTGATLSANFPTLNAFDASYAGTTWDAFVTKLDASGTALIYSTYLGGDSPDYGEGVAVDISGQAMVMGETESANFPTKSALDASYNGGPGDVYVTKLAATGSSLIYSTFLGGSSTDGGYDIAAGASGQVYLTGFTSSTDFPTQGANDASHNGGADAFVAKLEASGGSLSYSTYLGGGGEDIGYSIDVDGLGQAYVTGWTYSTDFPTQNAFDAIYNDSADVFVTKVNATGDTLVYSTYLGGRAADLVGAIAVDALGQAYVAGQTKSTDFPVLGAFDASHNGGDDLFVTKLAAFGTASCCVALTGNVDCDASDGVDISDLSALIDNLYITFTPLCCEAEANTDGQPGIDISDLSALIDFLYITFTPTAACQ